MSGDHDNPSTCLSASQHGPDKVHDFTAHYFGCIEISERKNFLSEAENEKFWDHLFEMEYRKLEQQGNTDGRDLRTEARDKVTKKRLSLANDIEGMYKRTDTLRNALRQVKCQHKKCRHENCKHGYYKLEDCNHQNCKHEDCKHADCKHPDCKDKWPKNDAEQIFNAVFKEQDCNLVESAARSHRLWKDDKVYRTGIQQVRNWKESRRNSDQNVLNPEHDQRRPDTIDSDTSNSETDESPPTSGKSSTNLPYMDSGRKAVRKIITTLGDKGKDAFKEYERELPTYDLKRDVKGYIIQWEIPEDQNGRPPHPEHQSSHISVVPKESNSAPERYLKGYDEDSSDFKGHFPDQRISLSFLLGENFRDAKHGIMSRDRSSDRVRYFHVPYNNMKWVEDAIARYFNESPPEDNMKSLGPNAGFTTRSQMILRPEYWTGQQHGGYRTLIHARHMRAICERVSSNVWESEDNPENFVLFMPFLHWEEDRKRDKIARIIEEQSENHQKQREKAEKEAKQARIDERTYIHKNPDNGRGQMKQLKLNSSNIPPSHEGTSKDQVGQFRIRKELETRALSKAYATPKRTFTELAGGLVSVGDVKDEHDNTGRTLFRAVRLRNDCHGRLRSRNKLGQFLLDAARLYEAMSTYRDQQLLEKYLHHDPPLHPRRTLDQSYYWTLKTTKARDRDQVVYRGTMMDDTNIHKLRRAEQCNKSPIFKTWGKKTCKKEMELEPGIDNATIGQYIWDGHWSRMDEGCDHCRGEIRKVPRVVMVDQLWMWILDKKTVITSFPKRYGTNKQDASGVHKSIRTRIKNARKNQIRSVFDVALIILDECSNTFFDRTKTPDRQPQVMDIFAESIGTLMNKQTVSFQHLWHWTQRAAKIYNSKAKWAVEDASQLHFPLLNINPEGKLQREIKDIIDELDIMINVNNKQKEVIKRFTKHVENMYDPTGEWRDESISPDGNRDYLRGRKAEQKPESNTKTPEEEKKREKEEKTTKREKEEFHWFRRQAYDLIADVGDRITELEGLRKSAESTAQGIKDLLDLKQQQAGILQAWQSVKQADESVRQGRSIMIFTIVTIIFLPLSFMSSVFGMNNSNIGDNQMSFREQATYMFPISAAVIVVSIIFAFWSFPRTIFWSAYKFTETWLLVHTGLYGFWLWLVEEFKLLKSEFLLQKLEEQVEEMKGEIRKRRWQKKSEKKQKSPKNPETGGNSGAEHNGHTLEPQVIGVSAEETSMVDRRDHGTSCSESGTTEAERTSNANLVKGSDNNV